MRFFLILLTQNLTMPASYIPHLFAGGIFDRVFQKDASAHPAIKKSAKSKYYLSFKVCLTESHGIESMKCCVANCIRPISETILVKASYYDDTIGIEEFEDFYPEDIDDQIYAVLPICRDCSRNSRTNRVEIEEDTECIIHQIDGTAILYRYIDHCDEFKSMRLNPNDKHGSFCEQCNQTFDELDYAIEGNDDDESISPEGATIWGIY